jgi:hypothetical protein
MESFNMFTCQATSRKVGGFAFLPLSKSTTILLATLCAAVALTITGCGSGAIGADSTAGTSPPTSPPATTPPPTTTPPPPTVTIAGGLTISWASNPESNIAGYVIAYGQTSDHLTSNVVVPASPGSPTQQYAATMTALGISQLGTYYVAIAAYNTSGNFSDLSNTTSILIQ